MNKDDRTLAEHVKSDSITHEMVVQALLSKELGIMITEEMLEDVLNSLDFIGFSMLYSNDTSLDSSFVSVEYLDVNLTREKLDLDLIVNLNELQIYANASFDCLDTQGLVIDGTLDKISLGTNELTSNQKTLLFNYLDSSIKGLDWITIDVDNLKVRLDFTKIMSENENIQELLSASANATVSTVIRDGYLQIVYNL